MTTDPGDPFEGINFVVKPSDERTADLRAYLLKRKKEEEDRMEAKAKTKLRAVPEPPAAPEDVLDGMSDAEQAQQFAAEVLSGHWLWSPAVGWCHYDGRRWQTRTPEEVVIEECREWTMRHAEDATSSVSPLDQKSWKRAKAAEKRLDRGKLTAVVALCRGIVIGGQFDQHPDLLNVGNGVVDLRTGELLPHDPDLLLTKITEVCYRPDASHRDLAAILSAVPGDVRDWLQVRLGQAATGHPPADDLMLVLQGGGENGKSTFLGSAQKALGEHAILVSDRVLMADEKAHPTEKMELRGARLAIIEEVPGGRELNVARMKKVVGTPQIEARYIAQNSVTFDATHTLVITTNDQLIVRATDHGTWRRLALVRFPFRYRKAGEPLEEPHDRRGDPELRVRALHDSRLLEAMLAWIVAGARQCSGAGLPSLPASVATDTRTWRMSTDLILGYFEDTLEPAPGSHVLVTDVYEDFSAWLASAGHAKWTLNVFKTRFMEHATVAAASITTGRTARNDGLSRPPNGLTYGPLTNAATALFGLRFKAAVGR